MSEECKERHHPCDQALKEPQCDEKPSLRDAGSTSSTQLESNTPIPARLGEPNGQVRDVQQSQSPAAVDDTRDSEMGLTRTTSEAPYSIFTTKQKRFIIGMAAFASFFSPISGNIYFPALNVLAHDLHVSNSLINLTLTSYMIFQGIAPTFIGDLADKAGRRPAYMVSFTIYLFANLGLALQDNYAALFVLRCVQSAGSSATIALASGVAGDISTAAERGTYQSYASMGGQLGPVIGPVLGGVLVQFLGWPSIFWFLLIVAVIFIIPFVLFFPETSRNVVGDGSIPPQSWNMPLMSYLRLRRLRKAQKNDSNNNNNAHGSHPSLQSHPSRSSSLRNHNHHSPTPHKLSFPNPLASIRVLRDPSTLLLLLYNALIFTGFYYILATLPPQYASIYNFNTLQLGLCYIPFGVGSCLAATLNGRVLDWNFRRVSQRAGMRVNRGAQASLAQFPIERTRLQVSLPSLHVLLAGLVGYGWTLEAHGPLAVALVLLFVLGYAVTATFYTNQTLLVDLYPAQPSTATAANNLLRCLLGAAGLALLDPVVAAVRIGPMFTLLGALLLVFSPAYWFLYFRGMPMRQRRWDTLQRQTPVNATSSESTPPPPPPEAAPAEPPLAIARLPDSVGLATLEKDGVERCVAAEGEQGASGSCRNKNRHDRII